MSGEGQASTRPFGFWRAGALVLGSMIGAGIFVLPAQLAAYGDTGAVAWVIAIAGALVLTWVVAGLNAARPQASGLIAITGDALGPLAGVLNGWAYWVTVWTSNAVLSVAAASYLRQFVPAIGDGWPLALAAIAILWTLTLVVLAGARTAGIVQVVTTVLKLVPLLAIVFLLARFTLAGGAAFRVHPHPAFDPAALIPAINIAFFALLGFEVAGIAAERVRDPARNVPRAMLAGVAVAGTLYLLVCTGMVYALPADTLARSPAPMALFAETFWGPWAASAVAGFAAIAAIGALNGWVLLQGEVPLGMARAGLLPRWFGATDTRDTPRRAILLASGLVTVLLLSSADRGAASLLDLMLRLTTTTAFFNYVAFCAAAFVLRTRRLAAAVGLAFCLFAIVGAGVEAGILAVLLTLLALPLYWWRPRSITPAAAA